MSLLTCCIVKNCVNMRTQGEFVGELCMPCFQFIVHGRGVHSQAFRNAATATARVLDHFVRTHEMMCSDLEVLVP